MGTMAPLTVHPVGLHLVEEIPLIGESPSAITTHFETHPCHSSFSPPAAPRATTNRPIFPTRFITSAWRPPCTGFNI